jgi:hypothetical protein
MTAVEWFNQQLIDKQIGKGDSRDWDTIFQQAKEMEKQQLKEMYLKGIENYDPTFKRKNNLSTQDKP